jgi:hypothetical protein
LGAEEELLKDIFTKQLIVEFYVGKLGMPGVVVKNCNYSMKHKRNGSPKHIT